MHVRVVAVTRNGRTHRYAQLVESYRRPDGMPAHRVLTHLGTLSPEQIENLRAALGANRRGARVAVVRPQKPRKPVANLRYLDLAVLLEIWRSLGFAQLLATLIPKGGADVEPADVVAALTLQRCADPGSKLYAERWFPRTALPELLAVSPPSFHNTRIHRVLDDLDAVTPDLMARLPSLYLGRDQRPAFAALYLDVTDAMFVGRGPALAVRAKTKAGLIERKVGIVLLCNERGYPLRWRVVAGNAPDSSVMTEVLRTVGQTRWIQDTPVIFDRALGRTALLQEIAATSVRFVTAVTTTEFDSYAAGLPHQPFAAIHLPGDMAPAVREKAVRQAAELAGAAGMERINETLWVRDFGAVSIDAKAATPAVQTAGGMARALELARAVEEDVREGRYSSFNAAARARGVGAGAMKKYRYLCRLPQDVQESILAGQAESCSLAELLAIGRLADRDEQRRHFAALLERERTVRRSSPADSTPTSAGPAATTAESPVWPLRVRVVAYFNPERFVEQRMNLERRRQQVAAFEQELNQRLANKRCRMTRDAILAAVDRRLRRDDLVESYRVSVEEHRVGEHVERRVHLEPVAVEWERRRRFHGFSVIVAHADLQQSAADLCLLYRAKDMVEKDFHIIKSVVELRPIRHRTEAKVSAHVTLCMLALALERALEQRLDGKHSAEAILETLATCHLNLYRGTKDPAQPLYALTEPDADQAALLRQLRMPVLADDDDVASRITPRPLG
jgi:hypothetical protein